jgi:ATP-dependent Lhr-like helicase
VTARLRLIRKFIEEHQSVLLFTNTRTLSEVLASRFKVWDINFPISIHHGSLSKISRVIAEKGFKRGDLQGLICTSSLELGIDIGSIDLVIQYMSPRQVTRLIQRVGRSGHRIGRMAKGIIITMDSDDTLEALVIGRRAYNELLEPVEIPEKPYDALLNQIVGCLIKSRRLYFQEILEIFKMAYPYREISLDDIIQVSEYMHNRFPRFGWVDSEEKVIIKSRRSKPLYEYFFENLSMIPDEKHYLVIEHSKNIAIGILDEAFVAEYGKPTTKFIISGRAWMILSVTADKIYVKAVEDPTGSIPSWVGEEIPVPFEIAQEVGSIRRFVEDNIEKLKTSEIALNLSRKYPADQETILAAIYETCRSIDKDYLIPTDLRITFEEWEDFIILITHLGSLTNRALALSLGNSISEQIGYSVAVQHDPYRIFIKTTREIKAQTIIKKVIELSNLSPNNIEKTLTKACVKTGIFKRRMIHVARRFGALKKHVDFSNISLHNLVKSFENTIIYEEALKEVFNKDIDLKHLIKVFNEIKNGYIELVEVITSEEPTPIAKVGIEKVGMKTDLIPTEKMRSLLLESIKARLLFENRTFICTNCWDYTEVIGIKDLPDNPKCPKCGSLKLGLLKVDEEKTFALVDKKEGRLTKKEKELKIQAIKTSNIIAIHGKSAVLALTGRRLRINDAKKILSKENKLTNEFYELIMEAEKKALKRQFL